MVSKSEVLALLPPFRNKRKLVTWRQSTALLVKEILKTHQEYEVDYDLIYPLFDTGDLYTTCKGLWDFCKYNLTYTIEPESEQTVKSPAAILQPGENIDCKHYASFIGGVLDAIKMNMGDEWSWCYRFASYDKSKAIEHVFVVAFDTNGKEYWVDPVLTGFNQKKQPTFYIDKQPMALMKISGIGDAPGTKTIVVDTRKAENSFLIMVNLNILQYKTLLLGSPDVTNTSFKKWYTGQGFSWYRLQLILNA
jgi:hypothetical protein